MEGLLYFDSHAYVGKYGYKHRLQKWRTEDLLAEMERAGIAGALVYHGMAKSHSPMYGNRLLAEELAKSGRLFGCWVVLPDHAGDFMPPDELIADLAERYPNVTLFMDHAGRSFEAAVQYAEVAKRYPNVTLQLTYTTVPLGMVEFLAAEVGVEKVLFGTDSPMRDPRQQLGWVVYADLPPEDKRAILGGNFLRILHKCRL